MQKLKTKSINERYNPSEIEAKWPSSAKATAGKQAIYKPGEIEQKWQKKWEEAKIYSPNLDTAAKPFYNLMMFPYPSAEGMHVGNMYAFTGADVYGRFQRMQGKNVFEPIGLDGFGIHSENYAIKQGIHPAQQAKISEEKFYKQLRSIGNSFDWARTVETYKPNYYKWTQWLFIQLFKAGLAYRKKAPVNFCPSCKTVLADEQVIGKSKIKNQKSKISENPRLNQRNSAEMNLEETVINVCERCESEVIKKDLEQWFFKITKYADRLLNGLTQIDWSEKVKIAQKLWIGKSEGAKIRFTINDLRFKNKDIEVFTTRADTLFGATFLVLAPEHPIVASLLKLKNQKSNLKNEIEDYVREAKGKGDIERTEEKTGVFSGLCAINPVNNDRIPVWIADYVLMGYGTGAIMAVPAHDKRDFEFAKKYKLPIKQVISSTSAVVFIHGAPKGPEDNMDLSESSKEKYWMLSSREELKKLGYKAHIPIMPTPWMPKYEEWKREFEKYPVDEDSVVVATSCGGSFIVRWLSETKRKIGKLILVAPAKEAAKGKELRLEALRRFYDYEIDPNVKNYVREAIIMTSNDEERHLRSADLFEKAFNAKRIKKEGKKHFVLEELPEIIDLITGLDRAYVGEGKMINSGDWNNWKMPDSIGKVIDWLEEKGLGRKEANYHLRDWLISRQRYWGPPIPMIFCSACAAKGESGIMNQESRGESEGEKNHNSQFMIHDSMSGWFPVPEDQLPVELPFIEDYKPLGTGVAPLASHPEFYKTKCPKCGGEAKRETDVSDTFLDSSWYFLRYLATDRDDIPFPLKNSKFEARNSKQIQNSNVRNSKQFRISDFDIRAFAQRARWLPVNMYIGGAEHSVLHLLYSRFITMALKDLGFIDFKEPFTKFRAHGLIIKDGAKMSKSKGNVVIPDEYVKKFGADAMRCYLMFTGPFTMGGDFRDSGIEGMFKFLNRAWNLIVSKKILKDGKVDLYLQKLTEEITEEIKNLRYNTAISRLMMYYNFLIKKNAGGHQIYKTEIINFIKMIAPFAPHLAEEMWELLGQKSSVHTQIWPSVDMEQLKNSYGFTIAIQINGRTRSTMDSGINLPKGEAEKRSRVMVEKYLKDKKVVKVIYVEGKVINFVVE